MKLKHLLRYPSQIRLAKSLLRSRKPLETEPRGILGIDLYTDHLLFDCARHLTCIAAVAQQSGYAVNLRCTKSMLAALAHKPLGRSFLGMQHVRWLGSRQIFPAHAVVLTDVLEYHANRVHAGQHLISMLIGNDVVPGTTVMPYPMHPNQISVRTLADRNRLRSREKRGIFFAGNQKQRYGRAKMQNHFGVLSRLEIVATLREAFPELLDAQREDRLVLVDTSVEKIEQQKWISKLAEHQFFVCCPGASQPMCHNVIEAMSVGVIPIIEYDDRFYPSLQDGENCIAFRGRRGLVHAVKRIQSMTRLERDRMSANVCRYFDRNLDGCEFLGKLFRAGRSREIRFVSMPFHDKNFFDPAAVEASDPSEPRKAELPVSRRVA
ncbi:glycosyltransferase family protein [Roseiconus lacunae]|uniref:hypothetical protein n=1 Tax=Roseiconus lacunae TaxID=2605694 RepID=UPI0011F0C35D|nr:hypothetical protein [Roseiconus lacunae]